VDLISPTAFELCGTYFRHSDTGGIVCGVPGEVITSDWTLHWVIRPWTFLRSASVDVRFRETWIAVYGLEVGTPRDLDYVDFSMPMTGVSDSCVPSGLLQYNVNSVVRVGWRGFVFGALDTQD
jgi:hypothetical protein